MTTTTPNCVSVSQKGDPKNSLSPWDLFYLATEFSIRRTMYVYFTRYFTTILHCGNLQIKMLQDNDTCRTLCFTPDVTGEEAKFINDRIREDYAINWLIDGLPAAEMKVESKTKELFFDMGFNLGDNEGKHQNLPALNNHYEIVLRSVSFLKYGCSPPNVCRYHKPTPDTFRVVGVLVWPAR